jgi:hypothetical protein
MSDERAEGCGEWAPVLCGPDGGTAADLVVAVMAEVIVLLRRWAAWGSGPAGRRRGGRLTAGSPAPGRRGRGRIRWWCAVRRR